MIEFNKHSSIYTLSTKQVVNITLEKAWDFFSSPSNLPKITPPHMGFRITSKTNDKLYAGQIISYKVGIFPFVKQDWVSEITQVKENEFFIDEQRVGPYKMWHHEHWFYKLLEGKTLIEDKVSYEIPFGILGSLAQKIFIKNQLKNIFQYRADTLEKMFNEK